MSDAIPLRPRTAPEIVDVAFVLARRSYLPLITTAAVGSVVAAVLQLLVHPDAPDAAPPRVVVTFAATLLTMAVGFLVHGAGVALAAEAYQGRTLEPAAALGLALRRAWPMLVAAGYYALMLFGGMIMLLVPAAFVIARYGVLTAVVMLEPLGPVAALRRAASLTEGRRWRVLATVGIAYVVTTALTFAVQLVVRQSSGSLATATIAGQTVAVAVSPFYNSVIAALYFDLRVVREGFDLESLAAQLDAAAPVAPSAAATRVVG